MIESYPLYWPQGRPRTPASQVTRSRFDSTQDRAKTIAEVAQVIVNSAKVEVQYLEATGGTKGTGFIPEEKAIGAPAPIARLAARRGGA